MENEEVYEKLKAIITKYISAWAWHLIAVLFLVGAIILFALRKGIYTLILIGVLFVAEFIAYARKRELEVLDKEPTEMEK